MLFKRTICLLAGLLFLGCGDEGPIGSNQTGTLRVHLTDAPGAYEAVNITFSEVSAHIDNDWITVQDDPQVIDLLEWNSGKSIVLGTAEVPAGNYTQIRLIIDDAEVVLDGQTHPMTVPSGAQSGLKLLSNFEVIAGSTYELVIDFDAQRSVVSTGPPQNPNRFLLKPTVRVAPLAITGSISGTLTNPTNAPVAYAIANADTLTSADVSSDIGAFQLAFLPEGTYTVSIQDTSGLAHTQTAVSVTAGQDTALESITLQ